MVGEAALGQQAHVVTWERSLDTLQPIQATQLSPMPPTPRSGSKSHCLIQNEFPSDLSFCLLLLLFLYFVFPCKLQPHQG